MKLENNSAFSDKLIWRYTTKIPRLKNKYKKKLLIRRDETIFQVLYCLIFKCFLYNLSINETYNKFEFFD